MKKKRKIIRVIWGTLRLLMSFFLYNLRISEILVFLWLKGLQEKDCMCSHLFSHFWLFTTPWTRARQALLPLGFPRQEYWCGLPFPSPGDLPNPGVKLKSPVSQVDSLPLEPLTVKMQMSLEGRKHLSSRRL